MNAAPRIVVTSGEPAGIGPDLCCQIAMRPWPCELIVAADRELLRERAKRLGLSLSLDEYDPARFEEHRPGTLRVLHRSTRQAVQASKLNVANVPYVLDLLNVAADG